MSPRCSSVAEIVVLGAGPAGLMAALDLATAGHRCVLLEAQGRPGGMSASILRIGPP